MTTYLITPCFARWQLVEDFLKYLYETPPKNVVHLLTDNHYPIQKEANHENLRRLAETYGCRYIDSGGDLGLHKSVNNALEVVGFTPVDTLIGCDADDRPSPGFTDAITEVMHSDPKVAVCALNFWVIDQRFQEGKLTESEVAGHKIWTHPGVEMWSVAGFNGKFLSAIGGFHQYNAYYGLLESYLHSKWSPMGMKLVYLKDHRADCLKLDRDNRDFFDPEYREWKDAHVSGYKGSFGEWLKENNRNAV